MPVFGCVAVFVAIVAFIETVHGELSRREGFFRPPFIAFARPA
jgi:hypothetical protein